MSGAGAGRGGGEGPGGNRPTPGAPDAYSDSLDLIRRTYRNLAREGYTPEQIGRLTDLQILELYADDGTEPGAAPRLPPRREEPASAGPDGEPGGAVHRQQCVKAFMDVQGLNQKQAEAQYARQLAEYQRLKAEGKL